TSVHSLSNWKMSMFSARSRVGWTNGCGWWKHIVKRESREGERSCGVNELNSGRLFPSSQRVPTYLMNHAAGGRKFEIGRSLIFKPEISKIVDWTLQSTNSNLRFGNFGFEIRLRPISKLSSYGV